MLGGKHIPVKRLPKRSNGQIHEFLPQTLLSSCTMRYAVHTLLLKLCQGMIVFCGGSSTSCLYIPRRQDPDHFSQGHSSCFCLQPAILRDDVRSALGKKKKNTGLLTGCYKLVSYQGLASFSYNIAHCVCRHPSRPTCITHVGTKVQRTYMTTQTIWLMFLM